MTPMIKRLQWSSARLSPALLTLIFAPLLTLLTASSAAHAMQAPVIEPLVSEAIDGGMRLKSSHESVEIVFCATGVVHIVATPAGASRGTVSQRPWIVTPCKPSQSTYDTAEHVATVSTPEMRVAVDLPSGALKVTDAQGATLLQESNLEPRRYESATVGGEQVYRVSDRFSPDTLEGLYGLGQHQSGVFNYRGSVMELAQANSDIAIPLLVSTNGYGLFWNTASKAYFDNRFSRELKLTAEAADGIDYYVFHGPEMDTIIHHYRDLTGHAPMLGKWAFGFVQSKDRYTSAQQLLDIAGQYRTEKVPLDVIVQDWFWWKHKGDADFTDDYLKPNPSVPGALKSLHDQHVHALISAWAVMDPDSTNYQTMADQKLLIAGTPNYDATNPKARDYYWDHLIGKLFAQGWDGFWLDSSEPETWGGENDAVLENKQLAIGTGARYLNVFPLMHASNIYDHWRKATDTKRAFLLTRSAFAGQQRDSTIEWSGDIFGTFPVLKRQIAAGMNFALSGMPYWTTDVAGYTSPYPNEPSNPAYQELYTRWFQFGTFCPILRTHGHRTANELFSYGPQTPTLVAYDKLRSRLVPYTYSLAWRVTQDDYTLMRPLVMDWRTDERVRGIDDQFMFGSSLLVNPVTSAGTISRVLYLPAAAHWYDFWTGEQFAGNQQITAKAPLDRIPLYVPAGSILPLGPQNEYVGQHDSAPLELRIYPGADGNFTLYDDAGDGYQYERGEHATITLHWDDAHSILTFSKRLGQYPGMPRERLFHVIRVGTGAGTGFDLSERFTPVSYNGNSTQTKLP